MTVRLAESLLAQGRDAYRERRSNHARMLFQKALEECRGPDEKALRAQILIALGQIERDRHELEASQGHYAAAAEIYRELDHAMPLAHAVRHVGDILRELREFSRAAPFYAEALQIYRAQSEMPVLHIANTFRGMALLNEGLGENSKALSLWHEARGLYAQCGVDAGVTESVTHIASLQVA